MSSATYMGNHLADLPLPRSLRDELVATGRVLPHHVLPDSGWVSFPIKSPDDLDQVVELFRLAYDRAVTARSRRSE